MPFIIKETSFFLGSLEDYFETPGCDPLKILFYSPFGSGEIINREGH